MASGPGGRDRRTERRKARHARHEGRRLVSYGDAFTSDELGQGIVELEDVPPSPELLPEDEVEPWAWTKEMPSGITGQLGLYEEMNRGTQ